MPRKTDKTAATSAPDAAPAPQSAGAVERVGQTSERARDPLASAL
jgi:hypothetical protein